MVLLSLRGLILSASLACLAVVVQSAPAPPPTTPPHPTAPPPTTPPPTTPPPTTPPPTTPPHNLDACGVLAASNMRELTYDKVAACYLSIPFNSQIAASTLESVITLFTDFYTYRDSALAPTLDAPFASAPVDIIEKLKTVGRTRYTSDHQFHTDLRLTLYSLYDAHASYKANCYMSFTFTQPMTLYAPVTAGKKEIRVFKDDGGRNYGDCVVQTIDGQDALTYLRAWTDKNIYYSKDPGVRLNHALATQTYVADKKSFQMLPGEFSLRRRLPEKAYIDFELQCGNSPTVIPVRDNWFVLPATDMVFNDGPSFVENVCLARPAEAAAAASSAEKIGMYHPEVPQNEQHIRPEFEFHDALAAAPAPPPVVPKPVLEGATMIGSGNGTVVYQLKDRPHVGVVVVPSQMFGVDDNELEYIYDNLQTLHTNGVTNLIIDLQGNGGGYVLFASRLVQMFFPNKDILDTSLPSNLRVNPAVQQLARVGFNETWAGIYASTDFYDYTNKTIYSNDDLYAKPVPATRYGRTADYSEMTTYKPHVLNVPDGLRAFPWTDQPDRIRVLTDGRCGSSCSQSAFYFTKFKGVKSYTIGGFPGEPMSLSAFPGGIVTELTDVYQSFVDAKITNPFKASLPYDASARFTSLEVFLPGRDIALDFDGAQYASDYRLDYTPENAKSRAVMWNEVATHAWQ
ncbi:hypothetical protein BGW39_011699 [Mortierella sp. 14UC]|nr:hypothetical protein BGW39_011699 [Mortierella sp. 14UC]